MENKQRSTTQNEFSSLNSSNVLNTLFTTSTTIPEPLPIDLMSAERRKAIIPTPNRPTIISKSSDSKITEDELTTDCKQVIINTRNSIDKHKDELIDFTNNPSQGEELEDKQDFDAFILEHFVPFSGKQDVVQWLDQTEKEFNRLKISRNLRFASISLLVEGDAKRVYIRRRKDIQSFDDFYELLITHFETNDSCLSQSKSVRSITCTTFNNTSSTEHTSNSNSKDKSINISNDTDVTRQPPIFHSTAIANLGITNNSSELTGNTSTTSVVDPSTILLDQTTSELRKAIVADLIKNPKVFKGGKDDVKKWIEDIEHLFNVAHIPDANRLDLVAYLLRSDALQWYKNNQNTFTSWKNFIHELQRAFISSFHEELAFKKLEAYTQGEHQSVRNFFNEVLKLCKEADSTMSETTKLKNLLNKSKPTIQFEVRKKKPTTIAEFLEYARDIEELFALSNITIDTTKDDKFQISHRTYPIPSSHVFTSNNQYPRNPSSVKPYSGYSGNYYNNANNTNFMNRSMRNNSQTSTVTTPPSRSFQSNWNQSRTNTQRFPSNRNNSSFHPNNNDSRFRSQPSRFNSPRYDQARQSTANTIFPSDSSNNIEIEQESSSTISCILCNQFGHDAASCQNFQ